MGRGQKQDEFTQVFGTRRGRYLQDTLLAARPSGDAEQELERLIADPGFLENQEALAALRQHRHLLGERPLLDRLADATCQAQVEHLAGLYSREARFLCKLSGLRTPLSEQLFADNRDCIHLCKNGREHPLNTALTTVCGIPLSRSDVYPLPRGAWNQRVGTQNHPCPECEAEAFRLSDCQETSDEGYSPFAPNDATALNARVTAKLRFKLEDLLERDEQVTHETLQEDSPYPKECLRFIADRLAADGVPAIYHALGREHWRKLREAVKVLPEHQLLDEEDWLDWLEFYRPIKSAPIGPEEERIIGQARTQLYASVVSAAKARR